MTGYVLYRSPDSAGPAFNEAASLIRQTPGLKIVDTVEGSGAAGMLIDVAEDGEDKKVDELRNRLPGWTVTPLQTYKMI